MLLFVACMPLLDGCTNIGTVDFRRDLAFHKESAIMVFGHLGQRLLSAHALLGRLVGITLTGAVVRVAFLALFIPLHGLGGAAWAAATGVLVEQVLTVATALRHFRVRPVVLAVHIWRPVLAAGVMAAVLAVTGLG